MRWRKVTLLGVGLLGGSLGLALRKRGLADRVHGYVRREASIAECLQAGAVDSASCDLADSVRGADLVVFCTPLAQMVELARKCAGEIQAGALITDVGSVKGPVVADLEPLFAARGAFFVGSHPMAGSEKMGVGAARADLFHHAICVVTPTASLSEEVVARTEALWSSTGARTLRLSPAEHDQLVARSSHLPHVLASNLARYVLDPGHPAGQSQLCASGFRDSTRIASGSPEMWRDIVAMNRPALLKSLAEYQGRLRHFQSLLEKGDPAAIELFFSEAKQLRDSWAARCSSQSPE